jgi:hypothetical protein
VIPVKNERETIKNKYKNVRGSSHPGGDFPAQASTVLPGQIQP